MKELYADINGKELIRQLPVYEEYPEGVSIHIEKRLPYLVVNRSTGLREQKIISNESSYIWVKPNANADHLIREVALAFADKFGACMLFEFWVNKENRGAFHIFFPEGKAPETIEALEEGLLKFRRQFPLLKVVKDPVSPRCPGTLREFFTTQECKKAGILKIGLEIPDLFTDPRTGQELPVFFRSFRRQFSDTVKKAIFEFIRVQTQVDIGSYQFLGRKRLSKAVWEVDRALAEIENTFEFLLLIAPANAEDSWLRFKGNKYNVNPTFHYRLLPVDPEKLKRRLYRIDIDKVDDPSIAYLFREKREELDTLITMLNERNSMEFMLSSIRLYKSIDEPLLRMARSILRHVSYESETASGSVDADGFAQAVRDEMAYYKGLNASFGTAVEIRDDMVGVMVSKGRVLISEHFEVSGRRVVPLVQHELGTHVLTFFNGTLQPLQLLRSGLAGYEELQEGIAVLSEYLVGGLTANRLRTLAARVTAAHDMAEGSEFRDVFDRLVNEHFFHPGTAFDLTTRIFQSGGYTKDIIYLRGLMKLMRYLREGGDADILFMGKIADQHVPIIKELKNRQILKPVSLFPRYMREEASLRRLEKVKQGIRPVDLIDH